MGRAARLHDDLDLDALDRERGEGALVLDLVDVGAEAGEQRGDVGERAGDVADVDAQAHQAARLDHAALDDLGQHQRLDVAAAEDQADLLAGEARRLLHQRREADRAGALDHRLLDLEQHQDRLLDVVFGDQDDVVDEGADHRQRQRARAT